MLLEDNKMEIEVTQKIDVKKKINVDFPYYYKHDLMVGECDSVIYGKVEENKAIAIHISYRYLDGIIEYELGIESTNPIGKNSCYFIDKYKSSEEEFLIAKNKMLSALSSICEQKTD